MSAPMEHTKFSKRDRKIRKKQARARHTLARHAGIETSDTPSRFLFVANAGLGNNIKRDEIAKIFGCHGIVSNIVQLPEKPFAFVEYETTEEANKAHGCVNGRELSCPDEVSSQGVKFYISFMKAMPQQVLPKLGLPPGLVVLEDFVTEDYERELLACIDWSDDTSKPDGVHVPEKSLKHRKVKHYGFEFMYGTNTVDPEKPLKQGIPRQCDDLLEKLISEGYIKVKPDQLTVNQYEPGQGIPPHIDTHSPFEEELVSLSLGSQAVMEFTHPDGRQLPVLLPQRSVIIMTGEARYLWTHGITPRKSDVVTVQDSAGCDVGLTLVERQLRTSFTFRKTRRGPCQCKYPEQCDSQKDQFKRKKQTSRLPQSVQEASDLETKHVHQVYEQIASHFSGTRHTPWPRIVEFLQSQPKGALMVDIGCGNGKYLGVNSDLYAIGNDHSSNLAKICRERNFQVFVCDILSVPLRPVFDVCICIAVIHHLSTKERRLAALQECVKLLCPGGHALIYVWALEQELHKVKSNYLKEVKVNQTQNVNQISHGQVETLDNKLPETVDSPKFGSLPFENSNCNQEHGATCTDLTEKSKTLSEAQQESELNEKFNQELTVSDKTDMNPRLQDSVRTACGSEVDSKKSCQISNSDELLNIGAGNSLVDSNISEDRLAVHTNRTQFQKQDLLVPWHLKGNQKNDLTNETKSQVYHRFYHVFQQGELEELVAMVPSVKIIDGYYDKGNWCVILQKL